MTGPTIASVRSSGEITDQTTDLAAVLFDLDGTLVDSERLWSVAMANTAAAPTSRPANAASGPKPRTYKPMPNQPTVST